MRTLCVRMFNARRSYITGAYGHVSDAKNIEPEWALCFCDALVAVAWPIWLRSKSRVGVTIAALDEPAALRPNFHMCQFGPPPTLGGLQRSTPWVWLWCEQLSPSRASGFRGRRYPMGTGCSSDRLRAGSRCTRCGRKGATVQRSGFHGKPRPELLEG